jgi:hypothetical protein
MSAILNAILCWLRDFFGTLKDIVLDSWDSVLSPADSILASLGTGSLSTPLIPDQYAWLLGATGMSQALTIVAGAMLTRFVLQSVPFVRWGS